MRSRTALALSWAAFVVAWIVFAYITVAIAGLGPCGGDGGSPYAAPASPAGRYCEAWDSYFDAGDSGALTTALVWLWPVALLIVVGVFGVWKRQTRMLMAVAVIAVLIPIAHVTLAHALDNRCHPDDDSIPGCRHY